MATSSRAWMIEAAALDLGRVVDRLAATGLDDRLERPGAIRILKAE